MTGMVVLVGRVEEIEGEDDVKKVTESEEFDIEENENKIAIESEENVNNVNSVKDDNQEKDMLEDVENNHMEIEGDCLNIKDIMPKEDENEMTETRIAIETEENISMINNSKDIEQEKEMLKDVENNDMIDKLNNNEKEKTEEIKKKNDLSENTNEIISKDTSVIKKIKFQVIFKNNLI